MIEGSDGGRSPPLRRSLGTAPNEGRASRAAALPPSRTTSWHKTFDCTVPVML